MRYLSVCSGIEAASVAWEPLGWEPVGFSEIEPFTRSVLTARFPDVPLHGDFTKLIDDAPACDVLVGGTPCQAFSVAGHRRSLDDARGNLSLAFIELANAIDRRNHAEGRPPCITVWENVPGVFSTRDNAFGCFLGGLSGEDVPLEPPGGRWTNAGGVLGPTRSVCWRVLDAQYFGLAQRRRRVFVVASARDGFDPAEVLLEWESMRRDHPPRRATREGAPAAAPAGAAGGGRQREALVFDTTQVTHPENRCNPQPGDPSHPLAAAGHAPTLAAGLVVRRLTPKECERLQGFPDDWTLLPRKGGKAAADGPRYKALGNSMAVPVMRWIGHRIVDHVADLERSKP